MTTSSVQPPLPSRLPVATNSAAAASAGSADGNGLKVRKLDLCILLTCFNRAQQTLSCLRAVSSSTGIDDLTLSVVLVDDGSTDGTAVLVAAQFPWVHIHRHTGSPLFWCRGMHLALKIAKRSQHDYFLLLNDDTVLMPDALARLVEVAQCQEQAQQGPAIVVGSTLDPLSLVHTYGGERQVSRWRHTTFRLVSPDAVPKPLDTFDGNIVLIPAGAFEKLDNLDPVFEHALGDVDLGLRARQAQLRLWLAPGFHGYCSTNSVVGTFADKTQHWRDRWKLMLSRKGLPWRSWLHFTKRHGGVAWPVFFIWPYFRLTLEGLGLKR